MSRRFKIGDPVQATWDLARVLKLWPDDPTRGVIADVGENACGQHIKVHCPERPGLFGQDWYHVTWWNLDYSRCSREEALEHRALCAAFARE